MKTEEYNRILKTSKTPVVVEFWAPWCGPCKMMAPSLNKVSQEFNGEVKLLKVNADESSDLLRSLKVMSIPTILAYRQGELVMRKAGAQPESVLREWFSALAAGREVKATLQPLQRTLRGGIALVLAIIGIMNSYNILLLVLAGLIFITAIYDRCPIIKAISSQFKRLKARQPPQKLIP